MSALGLKIQLTNKEAVRAEYLAFVRQLSNEKINLNITTNSMRAVGNDITSLTRNMNTARDASNDLVSSLSHDVSKFASWLLIGNMVVNFKNAIIDTVKYVVNMETALVDLNKVVDISKVQIEQLKKVSLELGESLGVSSIAVAEGMAEFGRYNKNLGDIQTVTKNAIMASNVTSMSVADASKAMTTAMIQFNVPAKESIKIIDSWNELQNNFRVRAEDLADSIGKVGSVAKQSNVSLDALNAMTTTLVASMGISGNEAGTALKSAMSRVYRLGSEGAEDMGKTQALLKQYGIEVIDTAGKLVPFDKILKSVSEKFKDMSDSEKLAVEQSIGGTYHYAKIASLLDNVGMITDATSKSINSQNSALIENQKYLDSTKAKYEQFKVALESIANSLVSSDFLKNQMMDWTKSVKDIGALVSAIGGLGTTLTAISVIIGVKYVLSVRTAILATEQQKVAFYNLALMQYKMSLATNNVAAAQANLTLMQNIANKSNVGFFQQIGLFIRKLLGLKTATDGVTASFAGLNLITTLSTFAIMALPVLIGHVINARQREREETQKSIDAIRQLNAETSDVDNLIKKHQNLETQLKSNNLTSEDSKKLKEQLLETERKLAELLPNATSKYDEQNNALATNIDLVKKLNNEKKQQVLAEATLVIGKTGSDEEMQKKADVLKGVLKTQNSIIKQINDGKKDIFIDYGNGDGYYTSAKKALSYLEKIKGNYSKLSEDVNRGNEARKTLNELLGTNYKIFNDNNQTIEENSKKVEDNTNKVVNYQQTYDELAKSFSSVTDSIQTYNKILSELNNNGKLTESTWNDIVKNHQDLIPLLGDEKALREELTNRIKQQKSEQINLYKQMIMYSNQYYQTEVGGINGLKRVLGSYYNFLSAGQKNDLQNARNLAQAKAIIERELVESLANMWGNYYQGISGMLSTSVGAMGILDSTFNNALANNPDYQKFMSSYKQLEGLYSRLGSITANIKTPNFDNINTAGSKDKKDKKSKEPTKYTFDGKPLDMYEVKLQAINSQLENYDVIMNRIAKNTQKLQDIQSKDAYSQIIDLQIKKLGDLNSKQKVLESQRAELINKRNNGIIAELQRFTGNLKNKSVNDIARMTEEDWANLYNKMYGQDVFTGYDEAGQKKQKQYEENAQKFKQLIDNLKNYNKELHTNELAILDVENDINTAIKERIDWQEKLNELTSKDLADIAGDIQDKLDLLEINDKTNYNEKIRLSQELLKAKQDELDFNTKARDSYSQQLKVLKEGTLEWSLIKEQVEVYNEKIDESTKNVQQLEKTLESINREKIDALASIEDEIVSALKNKYEKELELAKEAKAKELLLIKNLTDEQKKLLENGSKTRLEIFEEEHEQILKSLNDELKAYEDIYNAKIKEIDRQEDKDSYDKELNKKQQEKAKLQAQYDSLLMDSSLEAQGKRTDLLEQIGLKEDEINEFIHKRDIELRKQNLQDELESKKKAIQDKIDKENEAYKKAKDLYDREVKALEDSNKEKLKSENLYAEARKMLMEGNFDALRLLLEQYGKDSERIFGSLGQTIKKEIVDNLQLAINLMKEFNGISGDLSKWESRDKLATGESVMSKDDVVSKDKEYTINFNKELDESSMRNKIRVVNANGEEIPITTTLSSDKKSIKVVPKSGSYIEGQYQLVVDKGIKDTTGNELNNSIIQNFTVGDATDAKSLLEKLIGKKFKVHEKGGLNTSTGWHWLDGTDTRPELILNAKETQAMIGLKDKLPPLLKAIQAPKINLPKFELPNLSGLGNLPIELKIEKLINIEGNADRTVIPEIKQAGMNALTELRQALNKRGVRST